MPNMAGSKKRAFGSTTMAGKEEQVVDSTPGSDRRTSAKSARRSHVSGDEEHSPPLHPSLQEPPRAHLPRPRTPMLPHPSSPMSLTPPSTVLSNPPPLHHPSPSHRLSSPVTTSQSSSRSLVPDLLLPSPVLQPSTLRRTLSVSGFPSMPARSSASSALTTTSGYDSSVERLASSVY